MPLPEPDTDVHENILEVDDEDGESAEPHYAASVYPVIPVRYRVERFDAATINSSSRSLYEEELDYVMENGRRYCGDYMFPNDDLEQDRLRVVHQVFLNVFNFELTSVPLQDPRHILDIGTGTGEWAIGMAELYPTCEVVGVDISAIQPTAVPHNVFFEIDDCEVEWMRPENTVDLIHLRDMAGAFEDWDFIFREALNCLKPGGHIEALDFHDQTGQTHHFLSAFPADAQIHSFARAIDEASIKAGRRRGTHHLTADRLERLGFVDVKISEHAIPLNAHNDSVAKMWLIACLHTVEAGSLRLLTKYLDWDPAHALEACEEVCQEIKAKALDRSAPPNSLQISLRVLTARKPTAEDLAHLKSSNEARPSTANPSAKNGIVVDDSYSGYGSTIGA
ncbi:methyltransferase type 12 [Sporothrix brasiliensis 5110]|uniref:Methyltransferase type 12 n=1 Tax=Sporothrix brasiliensis 5110 TaxID=1398154 RepID=A0A0C2ID67_9PEZI|nr:methyltransferase type 12 [Sporothrix brasiliensis 5110]KIH87211.1 methyltransferase type 12 [Sporothrix brasiliensis 5110]